MVFDWDEGEEGSDVLELFVNYYIRNVVSVEMYFVGCGFYGVDDVEYGWDGCGGLIVEFELFDMGVEDG